MTSRLTLRIVLLFTLGILATSCGSSEQTKKEKSGESRPQARSGPAPLPGVDFVNLDLAPQDPSATTIQLYRGNQESSLPIHVFRSSDHLTLEFDLMRRDGRPLRVEFTHANRRWEDDFLNPTQYMVMQAGDNIVDYRESTAPFSEYVHYRYEFPNEYVQFKLSGNYVLTVLDPIADQPVLFERPFVVSEEAAEVAFELRGVPIPGSAGVWNQPYLLLDPRPYPDRDIFDWGACFVKNIRFDLGRCGRRPSLFESPLISFELEPQSSFEPEPDLHLLDISELRNSISIEGVIFESEPLEVILVPDLADLGSPEPGFQNGQSIVTGTVLDLITPDIEAEYVNTRFSYIPYKEKRASGDVLITGSFNGWILDEKNSLTWNPDEKRYEGTILIKQGRHGYQYLIAGPRPGSTGVFAPVSSYTALLYYYDPVLHVDRLVAVKTVLAP